MAKKSNTGPGTPYSAHDELVLEAALETAFSDPGVPDDPTHMKVTADIEWAGVESGHRTTTLSGVNLDLGAVKDAVQHAREARGAMESAHPLRSYTAKGWHSQLRALLESSRGSDAADRAGLSATERTVTGWLSETREPSKANREKIASAYENLRTWNVDKATDAHDKARHELAESVNEALKAQYGSDVRLRNITGLELS